MEWECHPLTTERWPDFVRLFGERGACGGCWCMWWRLKRSEFERQKGEGNKKSMEALVNSGEVPGILAYKDGEPVAWCSVAPRENFPALDRSRVLKRVDETPVWSIVCFFVEKNHRGKGLSAQLVKAALAYALSRGSQVVEAYPMEPQKKWPAAFVWTGLVSVFRKVGFIEAARHSESRPIMRYYLTKDGHRGR